MRATQSTHAVSEHSPFEPTVLIRLHSQKSVRGGLAAPKQTDAHCAVDIQTSQDPGRDVELPLVQVNEIPLRFSHRGVTDEYVQLRHQYRSRRRRLGLGPILPWNKQGMRLG